MISLAFINGEEEPIIANDPYIQFQSLLYESSCEIDNMIKSLIDKSNSIYMESEIMGSIDNEKLVVMEAEKSNVFEKLGNLIIKAFEKLNELIQTVLDKIKEYFSKGKTETDKIESLIKKHPQLKDEIIVAWKQGDLKVADAKSLKEMDVAFDEIIKMAKDNEVDPNTLQGKINAFKKKFEHIDESSTVKFARSVDTVIKAATAVVGFAFIFSTCRKNILDNKERIIKDKESLLDAYEELRSHEMGLYLGGSLTKAQMIKNLVLWKNGLATKMIRNDQGRIDKCLTGQTRFLNKYRKKEASDFIYNMNTMSNNKSAKKVADNNREAMHAKNIKYQQNEGERIHQEYQKNRKNKP